MAMRSVLNRLPPVLRKRAYGLTSGGAAFKARRARARGLATNAAPISPLQTKLAVGAGALTLGCVAGQTFFGSAEDFYDHRFVTEADPNALAEFYGNEDFMEIFCVFPFMVDFMMRSGYFDDNGHVHTFGLPPVISNMVVSMQFDEREEDDGNGETNTICFNKKERFKCSDSLFGNTLWEMVQNFGYATREDGKIEVYHYGQKWQGPFFIRLVFQMHARYVIYATEQHVNSPRFLAQDEDEENDLVAQRHNIPKHLLGQFLDGLDVDVQAKLKESVEALQVARTSEEEAEVKALLGTVRRLEGLVADLKSAKLKRAKTVALPLQRRVTEGGPAAKLEGSARGFYQRVLVRRATAVEEDVEEDDDMSQADGLAGTIAAALQHVESVAEEPGAIVRRLTAIEEVEAEKLVVRNAIVRRLTAIEKANEEEEVAALLRRSERSHGEASPVLKRYSTLKRLYTSVVNNVNDDELALEFAEAGAELAATPVAPEVVEAAEVVARTTTPVVSEIVSRVTAPVAVEAVVRTTTPVAVTATVAAEAREVVVEAAAIEPESSVAALVRRVTAKIAEAVEARTEASPTESAAEAPVRHQTQLSLNFPGGYGYGYPPAPYAYQPQMPPQQYAQQPQMPPQQYAQQQYAQRPQGPPYPYYYAPPPPPGYWVPPGYQHPMMVPQGAYYPGAAVSTSSSASQTE